MSEEKMLKIHDLLIDEVGNKGNLDVVEEIFDTEYVSHNPAGADLTGPQEYKQFISGLRSAFPDLRFIIDARFTKEDKVVVRWTVHGTHKGEFMGIPPTSKEVTVAGIVIHRFAGDKIQETWEVYDAFGLMQQLGVIPS
jgi:steroid delta-isomerase-like uncharacterized protein